MAEARTVDASKRMDRLVDAEITQTRNDRAMATLFLMIFTALAVVFFALGNNIAGGFFLGVPILAVIRTMWTGSNFHAKQKKPDEDEDS